MKLKLILIAISIVLLAYGAYWLYDYFSMGRETKAIVNEQEKVSDVLASGLSETDNKLTEAWREIQDNRKEIERLKQSRSDVEKEKIAIVIPATVTDLVDAFNKRGFRASAGRT